MKRRFACAFLFAGVVVIGRQAAEAGEDFMMRAVRDTMEGDVKGYVKHMFPKEDVVSVVTLPASEKFKDVHPRRMVVTMTNDLKVELTVTGRVNRQNTGGLPYTIEVISVSDIRCFRKDKPVLPDGAVKALADLKEAAVEAARKAAMEAYPDEKVESASATEFVGEHDRRTGRVTVNLTGGVKVEVEVVGGYAYDPRTNTIKTEIAGFTSATCTKNGKADVPAKAIPLIEKKPEGK